MADEGEISDAELEDGEVLSSEEEEEGPNPSKDDEGASSEIKTDDTSSAKAPQGEKETDPADHQDNKDIRRGSSPTDLNSSTEGRRGRGESSSGEIYSDDEEAAYFPNRVKSRHRSRDRSPSYSSSGDVARQRSDRSDRSRSPISRRSRRRSVSSERGDVGGRRSPRSRRSRSPRWSSRYRSSDEDERDSKSNEDYGHSRSQRRLSNRDRGGFGSPKSRYGSPGSGGRYGADSRKDSGRGGNDSDNDSYHYGGKGGGRGRKFGGYGQTKNYQQRGVGKRYGRGSGMKPSGNYGGYSGRGYHGMEVRGTILTQEEILSRRQSGRGLLPPPKERQCGDLDQFNYPAEPSWYLEEVSKWEKREEEKKAQEDKAKEKVEDVGKDKEAGDEGKLDEKGEVNGESREKDKNEVEDQKLWWIDKGTTSEVKDGADNIVVGEGKVAESSGSAMALPAVFEGKDGNEVYVVRDTASQATPLMPDGTSEAVGIIKNENSANNSVSTIVTPMPIASGNKSPTVTEATTSVHSTPLVSPTFPEAVGPLLMTTPSMTLPNSVSHVEEAEKDGATTGGNNVSHSQVTAADAPVSPNHLPAQIPTQAPSAPSPNTATESASIAADISPPAAEPSVDTDTCDVPMEIALSSPPMDDDSKSGSVCAALNDAKMADISGDIPSRLQDQDSDKDVSKAELEVDRVMDKVRPDAERGSSILSSDMGTPNVAQSARDEKSIHSDTSGKVGMAGAMGVTNDLNEAGSLNSVSEMGVAGDENVASDSASSDDRLKVNPQERGILFSEISRIQVYVAPVSDSVASPRSPVKDAPVGANSLLHVALETMPISPATSEEEVSQPMEVDTTVQSVCQDDQMVNSSLETSEKAGKIEDENVVEKEEIQEDGDDDDAFNYPLRSRKRGRRKKAKKPPAFRPKLLSESDNDVSYDDYLDQLVDEEEDDEEPLGKGLEVVQTNDPLGSKEDTPKVTSVKSGGLSADVAPLTGLTASDGQAATDEGPKGTESTKSAQQVDLPTKEGSGTQGLQQQKQLPPVAPQRYKKGVCKYYMNNFCVHGDNCEYSHAGTPTKKKEICKFYLAGTCNKGNNCNYYHGDYPCKFFHVKSYCKNGDRCKFSHAPLTAETRAFFSLPAEGEKADAVSSSSKEPTTDGDSFIVSISLSKLEERLKLKAFSIPKLKPPPASSAPSSTSFSSSMASDVRAPLRPPMGQPPFPMPPNPGQLLFPFLQKGSPNSNILNSPVPLFPPKAPNSTLVSSLAQVHPPPRGIQPSSHIRLPGFPVQSSSHPNSPSLANQAPPIFPPTATGPPPVGGESAGRKGLLPTPPISMKLPPDGYKTMKQVEYWEDSSVVQDSDSSTNSSSDNLQATPSSGVPYGMPSSLQDSLRGSHGSSLPTSVDVPNPTQQFNAPSINPRSQHGEVPHSSAVGVEPPQAGSRVDPRQSRLAVEKVGEGDPRLAGQWHPKQSDHRGNLSQMSMFRDSSGEAGMSPTPYQTDMKKPQPYQPEQVSGSTPYQATAPHPSYPPGPTGMQTTKQQDRHHFAAEKPPAMWGGVNKGRSPEHPSSTNPAGNSNAYKQQVSQPTPDITAKREPPRRVDPRLKYAHLKIKSKKGNSDGTVPQSQPSLLTESSSTSILKKDENARDHSAFEVPKLLQDPSTLNKPIDPRDLFRNSGGSGTGDLGYGEDGGAGPFGMFRSNLFSSRAQTAQEGPEGSKNLQQFGEITLQRTTPPRDDKGLVEGTKDTEKLDLNPSNQPQSRESDADNSSHPDEHAQVEVPSYLAQLDVGVGKDLKIESALGALGSKNADEDTKKEDKDLQARKLPDIFVGF